MSSRAHELWRFFDSCVGLVPKIHTKERSSLFLGTPPQKSILHHAVAHQSWDEADATSGHKLPYSPFHHNLDIAEFNLPWITFSRLLLMQYSRADFHRLFFFPSPLPIVFYLGGLIVFEAHLKRSHFTVQKFANKDIGILKSIRKDCQNRKNYLINAIIVWILSV